MSIVLQIHFQIEAEATDQFEAMYAARYRPALRKQNGYQESRLLRIFDAATSEQISAAPTRFNYQLELKFSSEQARREWVKSSEHRDVWPVAEALATTVEWRGYDLVEFDFYQRET
jgi:heme-degrading monooxygenase HmoA